MRRFPTPWTIEALDGGFKVVDANGQTLAYVDGHADARDAAVAKALTLDEARGESRPTSPRCQRWNSAPPADVTVPLSPYRAVIHRSDRDPILRSYQSHSTRRSSDVVVAPVRGIQSDASARHQDFYRVAPQHQRAF